MYVPKHFALDDEGALELIDSRPFALLVSTTSEGPILSHLPMVREAGFLLGHLASTNPHASQLAGVATAVFTGSQRLHIAAMVSFDA